MTQKLNILEEDACAFLLYKISNKKFTRNILTSIFKKYKCSYHKPGPKNHMKGVDEMKSIINNAALFKISKLTEYNVTENNVTKNNVTENNVTKYNILL